MRSILVATLFLVGCGSDLAGSEVASTRQALATPFLLELDGVSAGFVTTVTSAPGGSPCNATSLRFTLGPNMSPAARAWLNAVYVHQGSKQSGAIYIAGQNLKVSFSSVVTQIDAPVIKSGDPSEVFFTITQGGAASTCTPVAPNVMAVKNQSAAAWAARRAISGNGSTRLNGKLTLSPPSEARHSYFGNLKIGSFKADYSSSESAAVLDWLDSLLKKDVIGDDENGPALVLRDENGNPINVLRLYGATSVKNSNGLSVSVEIDHSRLYSP